MAIRYRFWAQDATTPADATLTGSYSEIPKQMPQLGQGTPRTYPWQTFDVQPGMFSKENWQYAEQTPEQQKKALSIYDKWGYDAVLQAGLQPPRIPIGDVAGFIRALAGGISGLPHETPGAGPISTTTGMLTGETIKYASLGRLLGITGAAVGSAAERQGVAAASGGEADPMAFGLEAGAGILAPELVKAFIPKVKIPGIDDVEPQVEGGIYANRKLPAMTEPTDALPLRNAPIPDESVAQASDMMLNSGVPLPETNELSAWWSGKVDDVADAVKMQAYKIAPTISAKIHDFFVGGAPAEVKGMLANRRLNITRGQLTAEDFAEQIKQNVPEQYQQDLYKMLDPGALGDYGDLPREFRGIAIRAREAIDNLSAGYIELGINPEVVRANIGEYMGRYYRNQGSPLTRFARGVKAVGDRMRKRTLETPEQRIEKGLVTDPAYALSRTLGDMTYDLETYRMFRALAGKSQYVSDVRTDVFVKAMENDPRKFGDLAGKFLTKEVYDEIMAIRQFRGEAGKLYDRILGLWKGGKVAYSPSTWGRNITSNIVLADLGGLSPIWGAKYYARAAAEMKSKGALYREAQQVGLLSSDFVSAELAPLLDAAQGAAARGESVIDRLWRVGAEGKVGKVLGAPGRGYQNVEHYFKMAMYVQGRAQGMTPELAAARAQKYLFDYGKLSPGLQKLRRSPFGHPFLTFTAKSVPVIAEAVAKHPLRVGKYIGLMKMVNDISKIRLGMSDEEYDGMMDLLPEWRKNGMNVLLPFRDKNGHPLVWDLTYNLPWGNLSDQGRIVEKVTGVGVPGVGSVVDNFVGGNPMLTTGIGLAANMDVFRDKPVVPESLKLMGETAKTNLEFVGRQVAPTGIFSIAEVVNAIRQKPQRSGEPRDILQTIADRLAGIRVRPVDVEQAKQIRLWGEFAKSEELKTLYRKIEMDGSLTREEKDKRQAEIAAVIEKIAAEATRISDIPVKGEGAKQKKSGIKPGFWK